ncbi:hypothetical protein [Ralstonia solanacearum]|uniref:hypothetical protein n=1 Tax=Ralstonia solanacearum TaxID=305 RepID=UPI0013DE36E8|nr:hypothetical protein [Ralstonia solanacearum]MCL9845995.1 hypothetical protein [Ralstonia solanacearum]MDC6256497.1 hypothetical protein [Ralstonia solanacearum]MDC6258425.1 hypothetical protein [Ralstonia solanacearum]MDC6302852.1 hypothetical protein [Ralstonia solanacearum]
MSITGLPSASIQDRAEPMRMRGFRRTSVDTVADMVHSRVTGFSGWSISSGTRLPSRHMTRGPIGWRGLRHVRHVGQRGDGVDAQEISRKQAKSAVSMTAEYYARGKSVTYRMLCR